MKPLRIFLRWALSFTLILGGVLPVCCLAQTAGEHSIVEKPAEKPAETPASLQNSAAPALVPVPSTSSTTAAAPASTVTDTDFWADIWNKLDPEVLWKNNGIIAWACLFGYIFAGMVLGKIVSVLLLRVSSSKEGVMSKSLTDMAGPANLALVTLGIFAGLRWLTLGATLKDFSNKSIELLFTVAVFWYLYNLAGMVEPLLHHLSRNSASALDKQVAPLVRRTLRVFLIIITVMYVFKVFGADIGAWLAGLGIAGIAVSLAAQDSLKNLFGSITILLDRPFKIGDRIICTGYEGVIEDIGFRSTKVRTTAGHLVSIPNANVVNSPIENISRRPGIRRNFTITLSADLPAEKLKQAAAIVREVLAEKEFRDPIHPHINGEACVPQVVCGEIVNNSPVLTITYWFAPAKASEFAPHSERLNLRILEAFEQASIPLAAPK